MATPLQARIADALSRIRHPRTGTDVLSGDAVRDIATTTSGKVRLTLLVAPGDDGQIVCHLSSDEAFEYGLVNRVVPDDRLQAEAFALARSIAEGPTIAIRYMKDNLDEALMFDFATARDHEAERMIRTQMTADHKEAVAAFIEKRKPVFKGG